MHVRPSIEPVSTQPQGCPPRRVLRVNWWAAACLALAASSGSAQDVLTHHYDNYRTGVQSHETQLTPGNIGPATFGKLFSLRVDGQVYAEPLWVGAYKMADGKTHNILFVATQHDSVYAFDADGKNPAAGYYWRVSLLGTGETTVPSSDVYPGWGSNADIVSEVGVTGTPVIDRVAGALYVVSRSKLVSGAKTTYFQRLHALSLSTGKETMGGPVVIQPTVNGTGDGSSGGKITFNALTQNQRPALALADGSVWIGWASHGDIQPYHGWLMGFNASNLAKSTGVFNTTPNGSDGGIWMSGGGIGVDGSGNLYAASGNGSFDANAGGADYSTTVMKFTPGLSGLALVTSFTPYNQSNLSGEDLDLGTSACTLIDNPGGPYPHLLVTTDKDGTIYLLDRDKMGGYMQNTNEDVQDFSDGGFNVHASLAFFNNQLYLAPDGGPLSTWTFNPNTGLFSTVPATAPDSTFGCDGCDGAGSTPSISANGTANAIVWVLDYSSYNNAPAVLHAFDPTLVTELYSSNMAANSRDQADIGVKFTTPTIANGYVYVGGGSSVTVFGLLKNAPPTAVMPVFSPAPGPQSSSILVTIGSRTPGATIDYTLDGAMPTTASLVYTRPIALSATTVLQAMATAPALAPSSIAQGLYLFGSPGNVFTANSGFSASTFSLNGSAQVTQQRLRLTDGGQSEAGSGWWNTPVRITNFTTNFDFVLTNPNADGMTFVLQNQGKTALGPSGGGLGYGPDTPGAAAGIAPSAAIKLDLYNNAGEGADSTGLYTNGASPTVPAVDLSASAINLHSGHIFAASVAYNGAQLTQTITDTVTHGSFTHAYAVNLPQVLGANTALAGFAAGTGGLTSTADILNWSYSVPPQENFPASSLGGSVSHSAPALQSYSNVSFPNGKGVLFPAAAVGQAVTFTVNAATTQTFAVSLLADTGPRRGIVQLTLDGKAFGPAVDGYAATTLPLTSNYGSILLTAGKHTFSFAIAGKNKASTGYQASFGQIALTP